ASASTKRCSGDAPTTLGPGPTTIARAALRSASALRLRLPRLRRAPPPPHPAPLPPLRCLPPLLSRRPILRRPPSSRRPRAHARHLRSRLPEGRPAMPDAAENVFAKNSKIHASVACTVIEGLLDGCNFVLVYLVIEEVFAGDFDLGSVLLVSGALAAVF